MGGGLTVTKAYFTATGEAVARAPKFTAQADITVRTPVGLDTSLEMRHLGTRWLTENRSWEARGSTVFDWTARYRPQSEPLRHVEFFASVENLFNSHPREAQFLTETQLAAEPASVEDLHFVPGNPRTFLVGVTVYF
jgi:outer membrane receptor protein involved in Fe transport